MSPENLIPPSAITGIPAPAASSAHSQTALNWDAPVPATTLVVQMDPDDPEKNITVQQTPSNIGFIFTDEPSFKATINSVPAKVEYEIVGDTMYVIIN
jgi:hypothetical protein